jgi:hypothetical protein
MGVLGSPEVWACANGAAKQAKVKANHGQRALADKGASQWRVEGVAFMGCMVCVV